MKPETRNFIRSFLDGFTGAGLFHKLEIPGAPTRMFEPEPDEEVLPSGEIEQTCRELKRDPRA